MPTNPIDAKRIADRTMQLIGDLDRARTAAEVKRLCGDWFEFADAMRVCRAIREHVIDKRRGLLAELEPMSRPADRRWPRPEPTDDLGGEVSQLTHDRHSKSKN